MFADNDHAALWVAGPNPDGSPGTPVRIVAAAVVVAAAAAAAVAVAFVVVVVVLVVVVAVEANRRLIGVPCLRTGPPSQPTPKGRTLPTQSTTRPTARPARAPGDGTHAREPSRCWLRLARSVFLVLPSHSSTTGRHRRKCYFVDSQRDNNWIALRVRNAVRAPLNTIRGDQGHHVGGQSVYLLRVRNAARAPPPPQTSNYIYAESYGARAMNTSLRVGRPGSKGA